MNSVGKQYCSYSHGPQILSTDLCSLFHFNIIIEQNKIDRRFQSKFVVYRIYEKIMQRIKQLTVFVFSFFVSDFNLNKGEQF